MLRVPTIARPIRHFRRYRHIFTVFVRHGFGFALSQLPAAAGWLRGLRPVPSLEPATLPGHFRQALEESGPAFVKLGQMLSTRPDLLPPQYIAELSKLQDSVPPVPWPEIRQVIKAELDATPKSLFKVIEVKPIAAASLGQVHAATLFNGDEVVIKIQRPNIQPNIKTDLEIIQDLARYMQQYTPLGRVYDLVEIAEDFADTLNNELNYRLEARNANRFYTNFEDVSTVYIPKVYWEYTTKRVLVLERIAGIKINNISALLKAGYDRKKLAKNAAELMVKQVLEDGYFHADPHPGNLIVMENEVIGMMDFGMVGYINHADRLTLIRLYTVAVRLDSRGVVDELVHLGAAPPDVNRRTLAHKIDRLLQYYQGIQLQEVRVNELITDLMSLAFEYHLRFPTNLWLLGKCLAIMEGVGIKLDPEFDIFAFSAPYVTKLLLQSVFPNRRWAEGLLRRAFAWNDLLDEIPRTGLLLMDRIQKGKPIKLVLEQRNIDRLDNMVTRMALSLIVVGVTISLALILPMTTGISWLVRTIVIAGFVISLALAASIIYSIIRRR